jgi:fatty-acyl-CoA synthase
VVGIPHETFGEQVVAVVELDPNVPAPTETELIDHVKARLASYKAPRRVRFVDTIGRAPNGKVDYKRHRDESIAELGAGADAGADSGAGAGAGAVT